MLPAVHIGHRMPVLVWKECVMEPTETHMGGSVPLDEALDQHAGLLAVSRCTIEQGQPDGPGGLGGGNRRDLDADFPCRDR